MSYPIIFFARRDGNLFFRSRPSKKSSFVVDYLTVIKLTNSFWKLFIYDNRHFNEVVYCTLWPIEKICFACCWHFSNSYGSWIFLVDSQQRHKFCVGGCKALLPHHYTYDIIMQEKIVLDLNLKLVGRLAGVWVVFRSLTPSLENDEFTSKIIFNILLAC